MPESIINYLLNNGPFAALSAILLLGIIRLYLLLNKTQEKRVEEAKETVKALLEVTRSTDSARELMRDLIDENRRGKQ